MSSTWIDKIVLRVFYPDRSGLVNKYVSSGHSSSPLYGHCILSKGPGIPLAVCGSSHFIIALYMSDLTTARCHRYTISIFPANEQTSFLLSRKPMPLFLKLETENSLHNDF